MNSVVTIGTFDGVHRGHRKVFDKALDIAHLHDLRPIVITFDRHPLEIVAPGKAPVMLMDANSRDRLIRDAGLDVERITFNDEVRRLTAAQWMCRLRDDLNMQFLVLGYDNRFGCDGNSMTFEGYYALGKSLGVEVVKVPALEGCSSSAIRKAVADGDMTVAANILGRPFSISGEVIHGRQLGRTIGIPTANLRVGKRQLLPKAGVYAARAVFPDGMHLPAVVNVGDNPTVETDGKTRVEAHIIGFNGDIYGNDITIEFRHRIRDERRFDSLDDLRAQIRQDIATAASLPEN